ncbi:multisubunit sodium/proton antiporter MrpA subunit /multisubunit sodium/proton antiporter MrpB subunit [Nocardia tenerifensis]|uniref:Multisubunit sodium/proton antiporter MrpA subunit /multisubunit sodium/proton antiporter MrpB subunit n=1 Tax=Nocardia tenerifensis TaxID=228006 RepID=A0A318KF02_9NOCA|nr:Na+/H+ antiporter subunit A [Nocardia tenerifensis]PXX65173.1 multisubunit sodium/proton antiporter MrpA subunit /multisubunit sodium/proton antiporter MrpB subunit [Nocardia tenerifensis]
MLAILLALAAAALVAPLWVKALGRNAFYVLALVPLGGLGWVVANWGSTQRVRLAWAPSIEMNIDLRFDSLAAIMSALVLGIGALILCYCAGYFTDDEPRLGLFAAELVGFAGAMFGLVTSDNMLLLFVFWEVTTVLSFLLVGHNAEQANSRRAAIQALLVTAAGGLAMLVGMIILGEANGSYLLSDLLARAQPPSGVAVDVAVVLILIGALSKSAVVPLHFWLPGAMAAPTPVSAYLHAAAMVKAGVYLVARLAPVFAQNPVWHPLVLTLGVASMLLAGLRSLEVADLKLVLAFGTVSQLGFLIVLVGIGTPDAALAGVAMLVAHALFKACLFMVVGIIDHGAGTRDLRRLSGLGRRAPVLCGVAILAAASMAGIPPLLGFVGKESALGAILDADNLAGPARVALAAGVVLGSMLTVGYSIRFVWGAFGDKHRTGGPATHGAHRVRLASENTGPMLDFDGKDADTAERAGWHAPGVSFLAAPAILAVAGLIAGLAAPGMDRLLSPYAETFAAELVSHLSLWHGFTLPLALTVVIIAAGVALFQLRDRLRDPTTPLLGNADRAYDATLRGMDRLSLRMTGAVQRGSLPLSQATILGTLIILPTVLLALGTRTGVQLRLWDSPLQAVIGAILIAMALGATVLRNRLASVLVVGVTGYGCGVIFALHGAPDLALTQFLVETLTLVIFVLVLRAFPAEIEAGRATPFKARRAVLAALVGTAVTVLGAFAVAARTAEPIWRRIPDAAYEFGGGKNAVNVLLVDVRAWDTLGEISVLVVAATGVASLVFRSRRFGSAPRAADSPHYDPDLVSWLPAGRLVDRADRSMVMQITTRLVFPTMMVLSVYFFFSGHNAPGGGFAGGLTAGLALTLRYLAGGRYELGEALPVDAGHLLGAGLTLAAGTGVGSLFFGAPPLSSAVFEVTLPLLGHVKLVTALLFDLGVYLIVVGLVLDVLRSLGARLDSELGERETPSTTGGSAR